VPERTTSDLQAALWREVDRLEIGDYPPARTADALPMENFPLGFGDDVLELMTMRSGTATMRSLSEMIHIVMQCVHSNRETIRTESEWIDSGTEWINSSSGRFALRRRGCAPFSS
jgi:hypothetical protein